VPELPEVELYSRYFAEHALHRRIARVHVRDERILGATRKDAFVARLQGREFTRVRRHGKHFFAYVGQAILPVLGSSSPPPSGQAGLPVPPLGQARLPGPPSGQAGLPVLHLHFGMTGDLAAYRDVAEEPRFAKIVFDFEDGSHLAFEDVRLFGVAELVDDPDLFIAEHRLGRDPLDPSFTLKVFRELVAKRRGAIKAVLMSQELVAGLGNLWVDETLFQTGIKPRRATDKLREDEVKAVFMTMRKIVREVIERKSRGLEPPPRYLLWRREIGEQCPRCGGTIRRSTVFGRTTYSCATHQR
jgi:formamidopyrimidine-DNA glycosylase